MDYAALFVILAMVLCGCSGSPLIGLYTADYRQTQATAGDAQLLLNILRAKDNRPIHFSDLAIIHGSIQLNAGSGASVPLSLLSTTAATLSPSVSANSQPTFDVGTLDTQDFTTGILRPITPQMVKNLVEQGVDPRIIALLFFAEYRDLHGRVFLNNISCDRSRRPIRPDGTCSRKIDDFLRQYNYFFYYPNGQLRSIHTNIYSNLIPIGGRLSGAWTLDRFGDLRQLDTTKFKLIDKQLYSISDPRLAICYIEKGQLRQVIPEPDRGDACNNSEVIVADKRTENGTLFLRSTYDILQFLGQVLRFQEEEGRCLTLNPPRTPGYTDCGTGEVLFQINGPAGPPVVTTMYEGSLYGLNDRPCNKSLEQPCDHSVQVLAILEMLLNANRAAKDILYTPRVQLVQ